NSGGQRYSGSHQGTDMYEAIDLALDKVTRQMRDQNDFWASDRRRSSPGWMVNGRYGGGNEY
ncbi:MAG: HPF/RaiA family ribosome-associated protein, partial [Sandaracinaceae bacterium]|nr:HPF/RaiA family ribosome-associated protein [Sandaracinaceae bacterium]